MIVSLYNRKKLICMAKESHNITLVYCRKRWSLRLCICMLMLWRLINESNGQNMYYCYGTISTASVVLICTAGCNSIISHIAWEWCCIFMLVDAILNSKQYTKVWMKLGLLWRNKWGKLIRDTIKERTSQLSCVTMHFPFRLFPIKLFSLLFVCVIFVVEKAIAEPPPWWLKVVLCSQQGIVDIYKRPASIQAPPLFPPSVNT